MHMMFSNTNLLVYLVNMDTLHIYFISLAGSVGEEGDEDEGFHETPSS